MQHMKKLMTLLAVALLVGVVTMTASAQNQFNVAPAIPGDAADAIRFENEKMAWIQSNDSQLNAPQVKPTLQVTAATTLADITTYRAALATWYKVHPEDMPVAQATDGNTTNKQVTLARLKGLSPDVISSVLSNPAVYTIVE